MSRKTICPWLISFSCAFLMLISCLSQVEASVRTGPQIIKSTPIKTQAVRDMKNANLPALMRQIVGSKNYSKQQLAQLRQKLENGGFIKPANQYFNVPLLSKKPALAAAPRVKDPALQTHFSNMLPKDFTVPIDSFDGIGNSSGNAPGCAPPDTNAAAGMTYVVEIVNLCEAGVGTFQVFQKDGTPVTGVIALGSLWTSGVCATGGDGDNVVNYDQFAQRWLVSQFAGSGVPTDECVAISTSSDPTGSWDVYDFPVATGNFEDYPKIGVWPDGSGGSYLLSFNEFNASGSAFNGAGYAAMDRNAMLNGAPANLVEFVGNGADLGYSVLPSTVDGTVTQPPSGDPGMFVDYVSPYLWGTSFYALEMWQLTVDWTNPAGATLTGPTEIDVDAFNDGICAGSRACIPQPSPGEGLDSLGDRLMFRLAYRVSATDGHQIFVVNQTVGTGASPSSTPSGIRWYELDAPANSTDPTQWAVAQQGTFMPADSSSRWMGSVAMDQNGNMALGYSLSSASINPSIVYTGRLAGDPSGTMTQPETTILTGGGVQESTGDRWGDYSSMVLDPSDDCTFWYAQEYYQTSGSFAWSTHMASFKFPSCTSGPSGTLSGTVTDSGTGNPIAGATITITPNNIVTTTDSNGNYSLTLPVGTYTDTVTDFGYTQQSASGLNVTDGGTTTQNFSLVQAPLATVSGNLEDATPGGHAYGLYGEIKVTTPGFGQVADVWSNPQTGAYSVNLPEGADYTFNATAYLPGYNPGSATVTGLSGDTTQNIGLTVGSSCAAPGYTFVSGFGQDFDEGFPPTGWNITNDYSGSPIQWDTNVNWQDENYTGGSGIAATADSNNADFIFGYTGSYDTSLVTPEIQVASLGSNPVLQFAVNYQEYSGTDAMDVDVSGDGGITWTNLAHINTNIGTLYGTPGGNYMVPVAIPSGATQILLRWRYYDLVNGFDWYAQVDNVSIGACSAIAGGLVEGSVTDQNTGSGLKGASVSDSNTPSNSTKTANNAADPNLPAAYYFLFSNSNSSDVITASDAGYSSGTATLNVTNDSVTLQNFALGAAQFTGSPGSFNIHVQVGTQVAKTFTIDNTGSADGTFSFLTFNSPPPSGPGNTLGAPLDVIQCTNLRPQSLVASQGKGGIDPGCGDAFTRSTPNDAPWVNIANYPTPIMDDTSAEDEGTGKVYDVGGYNGSSNVASGNVYDPGTGTWSPIANMPSALEKPTGVFLNGKLYIANGWDSSGNPSAQLAIYDPSSNSWTTGASNPEPQGGGSVAVALNGKMYIIGGCNASTCGATTVDVYDPSSDSWNTSVAQYPIPDSWESCGAISGEIYCAGGSAVAETPNTYVYDPSADTWTQLASIPVASGGLWGSGYTATSQGLLISGGVTDNFATVTNQGYLYTPGTNTWTMLPNSNNTVYRGGSACGFYKIGGSTGGFAPVPNSELLPGYSPCSTSPIPWLTINPMTGAAPIGSTPVTFTFDGTGQTEYTTSSAYVLLTGTPYAPQQVDLTVTWDPQPINLAVTATANLSTVITGSVIVYSVTVTNLQESGHGQASQTTLTYTLPAGVTDVTSSGPGTCSVASGVVTCGFGTLAQGASVTETLIVTPATAGPLASTFSVTALEPDDDPSNNSVTLNGTVLGIADASISSYSANSSSVQVGNSVTYTIDMNNSGPDTATGMTLKAPLPASLTFQSASADGGSCSYSSGLVTCNMADMASGGKGSVTITVKPNAAGSINTTTVLGTTSADPKVSNNTATTTITATSASGGGGGGGGGSGADLWMLAALASLVALRRTRRIRSTPQ
jgi:uncharacterized repeat protein (TIGR01451 family)